MEKEEIATYLAGVMSGFVAVNCPTEFEEGTSAETTADYVFWALTGRRFCYLSRRRVEHYRQGVLDSLISRIHRGEAFRFFYDIGPGYHATTRPGVLPLRFDVGLSEVLILYQIKQLCQRLFDLHRPGGHFWLVVDNVCALRTNDIPISQTQHYVSQLRQLIASLNMTDLVTLLVESEQFDLAEYDRLLDETTVDSAPSLPSPEAIDNVARFLGRECTAEEAAERIERYQRTGQVTDSLINRLVKDVHMTQRATGATLGFRPFPGGDQRTQSGELALTLNSKGKMKPVLLTSRNIDSFQTTRYELPDTLPPQVPYVLAANPV